MKILKKKWFTITALILSLPALLHIYNPSMKLEAWGLFLGMVGMTISPIIIFTVLILLIISSFRK